MERVGFKWEIVLMPILYTNSLYYILISNKKVEKKFRHLRILKVEMHDLVD